MLGELGRLLKEGDIPVWGMLFMAGFAIAFIYERVHSLFFVYGLPAEEFFMHIRKLVIEDKIEEAIRYCASCPKALLPKVVKLVLERADRDDDSIRTAQEIA